MTALQPVAAVQDNNAMLMLADQVRKAIFGRNPLIYLLTPEEDRLLAVVEDIAGTMHGGALPVHSWSCVDGLSMGDAMATRDPVVALQTILASGEKGFFVMKDLAPFLDRPQVIRALRECYQTFGGGTDRFVFMIAPELVLPESLKKEIYVLEIAPPAEAEIQAEIASIAAVHSDVTLPPDCYEDLGIALKGLTLAEIDHILHRILESGRLDRTEMLEEVFSEKEMIVKKSGYLEFTPPRWAIEDIGGLDTLKDWLRARRQVFSRKALDDGVPMPKGLLIMGVSGCGKSLAVKVISALWRVPLFRLDMNLIFSGMYGSPEAAFHNALLTLESVAPVVLWIDEIENGLGMEENEIKIASHIFSAFLTWMQEKPPLIFVAATANKIHALPAEIIRKGRFDQVFFVDLPTETERRDIIRIHLTRNGADLAAFDLEMLAILMDGWNGAEIEQAVVSARVDAYAEGRSFNQKDVTRNASSMVPLSTTMETQIKGIRSWAFSRAAPASKFGKTRKG